VGHPANCQGNRRVLPGDRTRPDHDGMRIRLVRLGGDIDVVWGVRIDLEIALREGRVRGEGAAETATLLPGRHMRRVREWVDENADVLVVPGHRGPEIGVDLEESRPSCRRRELKDEICGIDRYKGVDVTSCERVLLAALGCVDLPVRRDELCRQ